MIIHEPIVERKNGEVQVSALIERESGIKWDWPEHLYFAFPEQYVDGLKISVDPFVTSMLIPAMRTGENIRLKSPISPRLATGIQEYRAFFHNAHRQWARHLVDIEYAGFSLESQPTTRQRYGATAFSGGVDSTFSCHLLKEEQKKIPYANLKYALFIQGVDNPLHDKEGFLKLAQLFRNFLEPQQIELITARTNFILFSQFLLPWVLLPQVPLFSTAFLLSGMIDRFFIPSTYSYKRFSITGSSFMSDHWIATEDLTILHLARHNYLQKLDVVATIPGYKDILRVCSDKKISLEGNCGRCFKCLRTITNLALLDHQSLLAAFPRKFSPWMIVEWGWKDYGSRVALHNFIDTAWQRKKYGFVILGIIARLLSGLNKFLRSFLRRIIPERNFIQWKQKIFESEKDILVDRS